MKNQIQQPKLDLKGNAIMSLALGTISFFPYIIILFLAFYWISPMGPNIPTYMSFIFFSFFPLISILGLILGIKGLQSSKKFFAILGIILCSISLLLRLILFTYNAK